jgi:hypothetical protein
MKLKSKLFSYGDESAQRFSSVMQTRLNFIKNSFNQTHTKEEKHNYCSSSSSKKTYDINELHKSQSESNVNFLGHVLDRSNEFVVASEEISHQALLILASVH